MLLAWSGRLRRSNARSRRRIWSGSGSASGCPPTRDTLRRLHRAHLERVPFENFDIHLGVPIPLDATASAEKVALRHRGGFCYELNGAFASLLTALGFDVELREARVYSPAGVLGRPFGHACIAVRLDGAELLADVGFGRGFDEPIPLLPDVTTHDTAVAVGLAARARRRARSRVRRRAADPYLAGARGSSPTSHRAAPSTRARRSRGSRRAPSARSGRRRDG